MKVAILYRVIQNWRKPVFERLAKEVELTVYYGCDFPETKVVSASGPFSFAAKKLFSIPLGVRKKTGNLLVPFSPFLFFELVKFRPEVVLCEGASNFVNNLSAFLYCKLFNKAMIQWGLGELRGRKKSLVRRLLDPLIVPIEKRADAVVAYSSIGANYYKKIGIEDNRIFVAVNVVDTEKRLQEIEEWRSKNTLQPTDTFRVVFVGALEKNKQVSKLIRAFKGVSNGRANTELHIVGDGSARDELQTLVHTLELERNVIFHGPVVGALADVIMGMDVFVMPGLGGLAVSDMLCHGIPVICGIGDGCEYDLINDHNGILDDDLTQEKITQYLNELLEDPVRLSSMKEGASATIDVYNIQNYVSQLLAAIHHSRKG